MNTNITTGLFLVVLMIVGFLSACSVLETDEVTITPVTVVLGDLPPNVDVDCPLLGYNMLDTCSFTNGELGIISRDCNCITTDTIALRCRLLGLVLGDSCELDGGGTGVIDALCECSPVLAPPVYDCPGSRANIGWVCRDTTVGGDTITLARLNQDCDCEEVPYTIDYDCTELQATIGDACRGIDSSGSEYDGLVSADCNCDPAPGPATYDCPDRSRNIGDFCEEQSMAGDTHGATTVVRTYPASPRGIVSPLPTQDHSALEIGISVGINTSL